MKIKWFEILVLIAIIAIFVKFNFPKHQNLKETQDVLSKNEELVSQFYRSAPVGKPITQDAFKDIAKVYSLELAAIGNSTSEYPGKNEELSKADQTNVHIGVLQGQINDYRNLIKAMEDAAMPWQLYLLCIFFYWFLTELVGPLVMALYLPSANAYGERRKNRVLKTK